MRFAFLLLSIFFSTYAFSQQEPFITLWNVDSTLEISIDLNTSFLYDFDFKWIRESDSSVIASGTHVAQGGTFTTTTFPEPGSYILEIEREFPHLQNYPKPQLLDVAQWGDIEWESMVEMFKDWPGVGFTATDAPDLSNVTQMTAMFRNCDNFNSPIDSWDVSQIEDMVLMFRGASSFNQDLNSWDVGNVTNMSNMFAFAREFNGDITAWDVSSVQVMNRMLRNTKFNHDISGWDVSNVTNMIRMFRENSEIDQSFGTWNLNPNVNMAEMFQFASGMSCKNYSLTLFGWSLFNTDITGINFGNQAGREYGGVGEEARSFLIDSLGWNITGDSDAADNCVFCFDNLTVSNEFDIDRNILLFAASSISIDSSSVIPPGKVFLFAPEVNLNQTVETELGAECTIVNEAICIDIQSR